MAIGSPITSQLTNGNGRVTYLGSFSGPLQTVIDANANGLATADAATVNDPQSQVVTSSNATADYRHILALGKDQGTRIFVTMSYDSAASAAVAPRYKVFGRIDDSSSSPWIQLTNLEGGISNTPTVDVTNDALNGSRRFTTPNFRADVWDTLGMRRILVVTETAHSTTSGSASNGSLLVGAF
jgi:hypothetical protein